MVNTRELKSLSNDELLRRLFDVLKQSRRVESELVAHIAEVDERRLYAREATPSMFMYCIEVLHLSEPEAYLRIHVARATRKHPVLLTMLADGRLHLSGIAELAPHLDKLDGSTRDNVLKRATHKTKAEVKELVAELSPKPDVQPFIRKKPVMKPKEKSDGRLRPDEVPPSPNREAPAQAPPSSPPPEREPAKAPERSNVEPLAPARYKVQFTASAELKEKLERLAALMPGKDLAEVVELAVTEKLERVEAKRFGKVKNPRKSVEEVVTSPDSRHIPDPVKRAVCERDQYRCTFVSKDGRRCSAREWLEFHHDDPYALGGDASVENIRLLCHSHNAYMAELDFGEEKMRRYRRRRSSSGDRVGEPAPVFGLRLDEVLLASSSDLIAASMRQSHEANNQPRRSPK